MSTLPIMFVKLNMKTPCQNCQIEFKITHQDREFYRLMQVPEPNWCAFCRMIRRLTFRKERFLYHRTCDLTGKQIISAYPKKQPINRKFPMFPVYDIDVWWSDLWDSKVYGRNFDFSQGFFEQFFKLQSVVPRMALIQQKPMENSAYCNAVGRCKNCYLLFSSNSTEDSYYGSFVNYSRNSIDNLNLEKGELCYECIQCENCYHCFYAEESKSCSNSAFIKNCVSCQDCFLSTNLVRKQYYFMNKQCTKEEYFEKVKRFDLGSRKVVQQLKQEFQKLCEASVVKYYVGAMNENSTGNYLYNTRNVKESYQLVNCEDMAYCNNVGKSRKSMDYSYWGENAELMYECQACGYDAYNMKFCNLCWGGNSNLTYCDNTFSSKDCFGCVGLKKAQYCVLNKQYTKAEYEVLVPRIIEHMKQTREWGQFFPPVYSPFAYNESLAWEVLPLSREEVLAKGWQWLDTDSEYEYQGPKVELPDNIREVEDGITEKILTCAGSGRQYKIIPQELKFYREMGLPLPDRSPDQRHFDRLAKRNDRRLWERKCMKCQRAILTSYSVKRPETVLCESCYLKEVY